MDMRRRVLLALALAGLQAQVSANESVLPTHSVAEQLVPIASKGAPDSGSVPATPLVAPPTEARPTQSDVSPSELRLLQAIRENKPGWLEKLLPAILGLAGVFIGGVINARSQSKQRVATERANRAGSAFGAQTKIIEYRSKQAHEFYYPLFLSLQRSSGIRRQLCDHLKAKNPLRFDFRKDNDGKEHLFVYNESSTPARFRLIEAMHELSSQHPETLPMVDEIVEIGEQMATLIHDKGGLALASSQQLTHVLGSYLAHFSILREVARKTKEPQSLAGIKYNVLYPSELERLLQEDISFLQASIAKWSVFSSELWDENMPDVKMPKLTPATSKETSANHSASA